jgi:hypothetical protein
MADYGTYNPDRRKMELEPERRTSHTACSQKKSVQTMNKPPAETSVTSSTACQGITSNRNERSAGLLRGVLNYGPYEPQPII